jgi:hypothetical protein
VPGELALSIEKEILDWWRGELALPIHLGRLEMPHGGWTETVDSTAITVSPRNDTPWTTAILIAYRHAR